MRYKILSHTADVRLRVYGGNYEELFVNAAFGLASTMFENSEKLDRRARGCGKITAEAEDYDILLADFLNRILSEANVEKKIFPRVKILRISPRVAEAQIFGAAVEKFDEAVREVRCDGKIRERDERLEADLILKSRHSAIAGKLLE